VAQIGGAKDVLSGRSAIPLVEFFDGEDGQQFILGAAQGDLSV